MGLLQGWWGVLAASSFQALGQMIPACLALSPANEHVPQPSTLAVAYISMRRLIAILLPGSLFYSSQA